jgi:ATP-dependent helicase/DNAse subunit B
MALKLIRGPLNSGRRGLVLHDFRAVLDRDPVLVVPNVDDVFDFEREICAGGAALGGSVTTFGGLFLEVLKAGGSPPGIPLSGAQRLRAISVAIEERRRALGPLRKASSRPGFAPAFARLLDELQAAGLDPARLSVSAETLESSAYLGDLAIVAAGYAEVRDRLGRTDSHQVARAAIALLRESGESWEDRPLFLYGPDDLTGNQLELIAALSGITEVTVALPYEEDRPALAARAALLRKLRDRVGVASELVTEPVPENTPNELLFELERNFGAPAAGLVADGGGLTLLRSAGSRGEAEAIGAEIAKLIAAGCEPSEIAVVVRDPARRGPLLASVLESYGIPTALEATQPIARTGVGTTLLALLEAELGGGGAADLLRYLRGPSGVAEADVDWLERAVRRGRVRSAAAALELWTAGERSLPADLVGVREAAASPAELAAAVGDLARRLAGRLAGQSANGDAGTSALTAEVLAATEIAEATAELGRLGNLAPAPGELAATIATLEFRLWSGPAAGRVRIADPYRLRAARFDHLFVASLQDGEFPRRDRGGDPFLSDRQREALGLEPRRDTEAEERYLFYACLSLPRRSLFLSCRESDEDGVAEMPSPLLDEVRRLFAPAPPPQGPDAFAERMTRRRDLSRVVHPLGEAPSARELARSIAARGRGADSAALAAAAGATPEIAERVLERVGAAREAESATRAPGPLREPAVIESLAAVPAHGGTTLEEFDLCSYRWFVGHELDPQPLDPTPDALVQGGLMHSVLERLYRERPGGGPLPRPDSLPLWQARGRELIAAIAAERAIGPDPSERAVVRRVERLLDRFLIEESRRETGGFEPWLLEAAFGEQEESERPPLQIDDWALHGAIDRVDRDAAGNALVLDYKVARSVAPRDKFEERAKLQLQLYLLAVAEHWGARTVGGLYHPLRGTSLRRPRGVVLEEVAESLASYRLYGNDVVGEEELAELLEEARRRAGAIVARMRRGEIRRDPGPRRGLRGHGVCPPFCDFAPICRRDRAPVAEEDFEGDEP